VGRDDIPRRKRMSGLFGGPDGSARRSRGLWLAAAGLALAIGVTGLVVALIGEQAGARRVMPSPTQQVNVDTEPPLPYYPVASYPPPPVTFPDVVPPRGVPLIWATRPWEQLPGRLRLHALDWDGREVGRLEVLCDGRCFVQQSPDGHRLLAASGERADILDETGRPVGQVPTDAVVSWADDSRHLCLVRALPSVSGTVQRAALELAEPGSGASRLVATVEGTVWYRGAWLLRGCSVRADRAVLALQNSAVISGIRAIQLSTGRVVYLSDDLLPPPGPVCNPCHLAPPLIVSTDGAVAVENLASGAARQRDLATGATSPWALQPLDEATIALSWGGRLAVTSRRVVDVASGRAVWRAPSVVEHVVAQPDGDAVLVVLASRLGAESQMRIVHPDGSSVALGDLYLA
jgi:hypothetical protein